MTETTKNSCCLNTPSKSHGTVVEIKIARDLLPFKPIIAGPDPVIRGPGFDSAH